MEKIQKIAKFRIGTFTVHHSEIQLHFNFTTDYNIQFKISISSKIESKVS